MQKRLFRLARGKEDACEGAGGLKRRHRGKIAWGKTLKGNKDLQLSKKK